MRASALIASIASALLGAACATSSPPPDRQLADSRAAVRVAQETGAAEDPQAAAYLKAARQQLAEADEQLALRNYTTADRALRKAQANAELAASLAREGSARAEAIELRRQAEALETRVP